MGGLGFMPTAKKYDSNAINESSMLITPTTIYLKLDYGYTANYRN